MRKVNVLVTGIGGPTAQGIMRGLNEKENVYIVGADRRTISAGHHLCQHSYQIPRFTDTEAYKQAIKDIVLKENIDVVFPALHEEIDIYETFQQEVEAFVALPQTNIIEVLQDKEKLYMHLASEGLSRYIPKYYGFSTSEELRRIAEKEFADAPYIVVKQVEGHGSLGFAILTDRENYLHALKLVKPKVLNIEDYYDLNLTDRRIVMDYMEGVEFSVDVYLHEGQVVTAIPRERTGVSNGIVLDGYVVNNKQLIQMASEISPHLAVNGFLNLQFITTDDGYKLTDVNPRFCGSQVMSLGAGVNFPYLFIQYHVLDERPVINPIWNARMIRYRDHFFVYED